MSTKEPPKTPTYYDHDGFLMPVGFPVEGFKSALQYKPLPTDFFIVTYPKCGTTWTQYIMYLMSHNAHPMPPDDKMDYHIPHLEELGSACLEKLPHPRIIKTHLPFDLTPWNPQAKYLYVVRNPFDCLVSFYHHTVGFVYAYNFENGSFDDYFECFLQGKVDFGDYFDHVLSWYPHQNDPNVLFLTYEEMKKDTFNAIKQIYLFLKSDISRDRNPREKKVVLSPEELELIGKIVEQSSFEKMKVNQLRWCSKRPETASEFVRKGQSKDWVNHLSTDQFNRLMRKYEEKLKDTELYELWKDVLA